MLTIRQRPFDPLDRSEAGHWEGDLIIGKDQGSAIGTLVERQTRTVRLLHMPYRDSDTLHDALQARMADLPSALLRSITWDQGTEMARHLTITRSLGVPVYFCDSHSPWQRGSNENMNGLLRDYLMFQLRRLDIWPIDLGVRQGYALAWKLDRPPIPKQLEPLGARFRPYRSIVARYCWAAVPLLRPGGTAVSLR
jgi:hypothetical protein